MTQTCANIYLAEHRGCTIHSDWYRSFHTLNFGGYFSENRQPFGCIQVFNDNTLRGGHSIKMKAEKPTQLMLIPLVGGIEFNFGNNGRTFIEAGEVLRASITEGGQFEVSNPFEKEELVNYLEIWLQDSDTPIENRFEKAAFDINRRNHLLPLFLNKNDGFIGKYEGREEGTYKVKRRNSGILIFIIEGVFEVQNRLLHVRDCLSFQDVEKVEFEALSNNAIILLIETHL